MLFNLSRLAALMPVAVLLTVSFFVLVTVTKTAEKWLKILGYLAVALLWIAALGNLCGAQYRPTQAFVNQAQFRDMLQSRAKTYIRSQVLPNYNVSSVPVSGSGPASANASSGCTKCQACQANKSTAKKAPSYTAAHTGEETKQ